MDSLSRKGLWQIVPSQKDWLISLLHSEKKFCFRIFKDAQLILDHEAGR